MPHPVDLCLLTGKVPDGMRRQCSFQANSGLCSFKVDIATSRWSDC